MAIRDWFSRKADAPGIPTSRANRAIVLGLNMPGPMEHVNYAALAGRGFERCIPVYQCVSAIMKAAATVPWVLNEKRQGNNPAKGVRRYMTKATAQRAWTYRGKNAKAVQRALENTKVDEHPLLKLIERPNPEQDAASYVSQNIAYFLLSGNSYEEFIAPTRANATPQAMFNLRPDRVKVIPNTALNRQKYPELAQTQKDDMALVLGYEYEVGGVKQYFAASSVNHRKFFHATNDYYGLSPLQVAMRQVDTVNLSVDWNYALIKNQARPSGAMVVPTMLNDDSYKRAKEQLLESYAGADNAGIPMLLEGGLEWKPMSLTPAELDWLEGVRDLRVQICGIYNTPPELIGDSDHRTYNSLPEARLAFWQEAVLPLIDMIRDSWNLKVAPLFGDNIFLDYDRDQIDAIQEEQSKVWARIEKAQHMSVNEKRLMTGFEESDEDGADTPILLLTGQQQVAAQERQLELEHAKLTTAQNTPDNAQNPDGGTPQDGEGNRPPAKKPAKKDLEDLIARLETLERKAQKLTTAQKRQLGKLKRQLSDFFRRQGEALADHLGSAL